MRSRERLEAFWREIEERAEGEDDQKVILRANLVGIISDRFGLSNATRWGYIKLLEELGWIRESRSGNLFFIIRMDGVNKKINKNPKEEV